MISTTPPNVSALDKRMQAMALLREATDLDGLSAYAVHHRHEHGGSSYVLWSKNQPNEAEAQGVLDAPFEPDRGEDLAVDTLTLEELVGISRVSQAEEGHRTMTPGTWVSTLGHPVDPREVAEWVGLHHRAHLDSQPQRLQEWIDRFVEAHPDRFTTYLVSDRWVHSFAGRETITRWVYRIDGDYEGLTLGQRQEPTGQWISLNGEARQDLESSLRDNDIPAANNLPAHWGDQVRCTTQLPDWALVPPLQSAAQALMELNRHPGLDPSVAAPLDLLLGREPEGDATVSASRHPHTTSKDSPMSEQASRFSEEDGYLAHDRAYLLAHEAASKALAAGHIKSFCCRHDRERGRIIEVQTEQGWDPSPAYVEFEKPSDNMAAVW